MKVENWACGSFVTQISVYNVLWQNLNHRTALKYNPNPNPNSTPTPLTLNSKWPPFFIQYLRDDPPPPPHISSYMFYKVLLKCM